VTGGDHDAHGHAHDASTGGYPTHEGQLDSSRWPDMTAKELLVIIPLVVLTIVAGVYPKPLFDIMEPSLTAVLENAVRVVGN
jgi:NADH:ubiquinone oxidoreductase subunit 4 (subunit M)